MTYLASLNGTTIIKSQTFAFIEYHNDPTSNWLGIGVASAFRIRKTRVVKGGNHVDPATTLQEPNNLTSEELQNLKERDDAVTKIFYRYGPPTFGPKRVEYLLGLGMSQTEVADAMKIPEDAVRVLCGENLVTSKD